LFDALPLGALRPVELTQFLRVLQSLRERKWLVHPHPSAPTEFLPNRSRFPTRVSLTATVATILIIESDRSVAALLAAVVEVAGATPVYEPGAGGSVPDVLLIEPAAAGAVETATALRAAHPGLPIVCVSAYKPTAELRVGLEPAAFLSKPFAVAELHATLAALLPRRER